MMETSHGKRPEHAPVSFFVRSTVSLQGWADRQGPERAGQRAEKNMAKLRRGVKDTAYATPPNAGQECLKGTYRSKLRRLVAI